MLPVLSVLLLAVSRAAVYPVDLKANNGHSDVVDGDRSVLLSWKLRHAEGVLTNIYSNQRGYEISTSSTPTFTTIDWSTGYVNSNESLSIEYGGSRHSSQVVYWKLTVFDGNNSTSSEMSYFEFGLLSDDDWGSSVWLMRDQNVGLKNECDYFAWNATPIFQTSLPVAVNIASARLYIAGLGYFKAFLANGDSQTKLGDSYLDPPFSVFSKRVYYETFNITSLLNSGSNTLRVELGNGWWNPAPMLMWGHMNIREYLSIGTPMFKAIVKVTYSNGTVVEYPSTSKSWKSGNGATLFNNIYLGEVFDSRIEDPWSSVTMTPYEEVSPKNIGKLQARTIPVITQQEQLPARQQGLPVAKPNDRYSVVFDSTKNHAGICSYEFHGKSGDVINMEYGELLSPDGSVNVLTSTAGQIKGFNKNFPCQPNVAKQAATLILKDGLTSWQPSFSWHGMRYIGLDLPNGASVVSISCTPLRTNTSVIVDFNTNDDSIKKLREITYNTFGSNMMSVQSDCPHRERFGYGGDALACGESALNMYDFSQFYAKRLIDFTDSQIDIGGFPETAPYVGISTDGLGGTSGPIGWEAYQPEVQLWLYRYYGNKDALITAFNSTYKYIKLLDTNPKAIQNGLGDWMPVEPTGVDFTGLGFQRMSYLAFANITSILGYDDLSDVYSKKAANMTIEINDKFLNTTSGSYGNVKKGEKSSPYYTMGGGSEMISFSGSQTGQGMALFQKIVPDNLKDKALAVLVDNIKSASFIPGAGQGPKVGGAGPHMLSGMFGTKWVAQSLSESGYVDLAYDIMVGQKTYPSYLWMTQNEYVNATTVWESWFYSDNEFSHNHPMFISSEQWFIQSLAGLIPHPAAKGFNKVLIQPRPPLSMAKSAVNQMAVVDLTYQSVRGEFRIHWTLDARTRLFRMNVTVPPNVEAFVSVPGGVQQQPVLPGTHSYQSTIPDPPTL